MTDFNGHSRWSPSRAHRWIACPASVGEEERVPAAPPSLYARDGTAIAKVAEECLKNEGDPTEWIGKSVAGKDIDADDIEPLRVYLNHVKGLGGPDAIVIPEARLDASEIWPGLHGTADCLVIDPPALYISDLKWGQGVYVSAKDNPQLLIYGLGALLRYGNHGIRPVEHLHFSIVQPRYATGEPVRTMSMPAQQLLDWSVRKLLPALRATEEKNPRYSPGDHCRFCAARATCPVLKDFALEQVRQDFAKASDLTNEEIAHILDRASIVEAWVQAVRDESMRRAQRGEDIPGYILTTGRSIRKWREKDEHAAALALFALGLKEADVWDTKLRSPAQIEKRFPKDHRHDALVDLIESVPGGAKLIKDDGRTPLVPHIAEDFMPTYLA